MKTTKALLIALALGLPAGLSLAQDTANNPPPEGGQPPAHHEGPPGGPGGPGGPGHRPPVPPLMAALDANGDGVIDANEIASAAAALAKLDKNGDGQLTMDEVRPPRPPGRPGPGFGPRGQGPQEDGANTGANRPQRPLRRRAPAQ